MKFVIAALLALSSAAPAMAFQGLNFPDFQMQTQYEKSVITKDAFVRAYAQKLGAASFAVTAGTMGKRSYTVATSNNCAFSVKINYGAWPKIQSITVYSNAVCR